MQDSAHIILLFLFMIMIDNDGRMWLSIFRPLFQQRQKKESPYTPHQAFKWCFCFPVIDLLYYLYTSSDVFPTGVCVRAFLHSLLVYLAEMSMSTSTTPVTPSLTSVNLVIGDAVSTDFAADFLRQALEVISQQGLEEAVTEVYNNFRWVTPPLLKFSIKRLW